MNEEPLFDFAVPDDLLREAVQHARDPDVIADVTLMPGTGDGKPPPLLGILRDSGYAPLVLMTVAAVIPGTFGNGINLIGHNLEVSFHMSNAALGAVAFVAQVVPAALGRAAGAVGRPREPQVVAGVALLIFAVFGSAMALSPNVWAFAFLYLAASVGHGVNNTVHNSYLSDAYPDRGRGRIFSWHNLSDPISQTIGILHLRLRGDGGPQLALRPSARAWPAFPMGFALFTLARAREGGQREQPHPQGLGHGPAFPAGEGAPGPAGLGHDPAPAHPVALLRAGGGGHPRLRRHRFAACSATSS